MNQAGSQPSWNSEAKRCARTAPQVHTRRSEATVALHAHHLDWKITTVTQRQLVEKVSDITTIRSGLRQGSAGPRARRWVACSQSLGDEPSDKPVALAAAGPVTIAGRGQTHVVRPGRLPQAQTASMSRIFLMSLGRRARGGSVTTAQISSRRQTGVIQALGWRR